MERKEEKHRSGFASSGEEPFSSSEHQQYDKASVIWMMKLSGGLW